MDRLVYKTENRIGHIEGRDLGAYEMLQNVHTQNEEEPLLPTGFGPENKQNKPPKPKEAEEPLLPTGFGNKPKK